MQPVIRHRNGKLFIDNTPLVEGALQKSYLLTAGVAGDGEIYVKSATGFLDSEDEDEIKALLIGELGDENAEIRLFSETLLTELGDQGASVIFSEGNNDVDNILKYSHEAGTPVYLIKYDQIELRVGSETDPDEASTISTDVGVGLVYIQPDTKIQVVDPGEEFEEGYIFARYALNEAGIS